MARAGEDGLGAGPVRLGRAAARGTVATLTGQWAGFALQTLALTVLSRLLSTTDYGVMAQVLVITGFADLLKDLGLGAATVQRKEISDRQVNALFWVNSGTGVLLTAVVAALAPAVGAFYGNDAVTHVTLALSLSFLLSGTAVQHTSLLNRSLEFRRLTTIDLGSRAVGLAVAIGVALAGGGVWSLVASQLVTTAMRTVQLWVACPWRPSRPGWAPDMREMLGFGGYLSAFTVVNYASRNVDNLLVGKVWGADVLGLYSRAYQLLLMPLQQINNPVTRVAVPTLSRLQDEPERFRRYYRTAVTLMGAVAVPVVAMLAVLADEAIRVVLGAKWVDAAPIFQALAVAGVAQTVTNANGWLYQSTGQTRRQFVWGLVTRAIIIAGFLLSVRHGVLTLAVVYAVVNVVLFVPSLVVAARGTPVAGLDAVSALVRPGLVSAVAVLAGWAARRALLETPLPVRVAGSLLAFAAVYALVLLLWRGARDQVLGVTRLVRDAADVKRGRRGRAEVPSA